MITCQTARENKARKQHISEREERNSVATQNERLAVITQPANKAERSYTCTHADSNNIINHLHFHSHNSNRITLLSLGQQHNSGGITCFEV